MTMSEGRAGATDAPAPEAGIVQHVWHKVGPKTEDVYNIPLASGFITGEALVLLVLAAAAFK